MAARGEATGLDGALRSLLGAPLGRIVLSLVALGFAAYGVYSFARARYARVERFRAPARDAQAHPAAAR